MLKLETKHFASKANFGQSSNVIKTAKSHLIITFGSVVFQHLWIEKARSHLSFPCGFWHATNTVWATSRISSSNLVIWDAIFSKCGSPFSSTILLHCSYAANEQQTKPQFNLFYISAQNFGLNIKRSGYLALKDYCWFRLTNSGTSTTCSTWVSDLHGLRRR